MPGLLPLTSDQFGPSRSYLQAVALIIGGLQRAFIKKQPHDWQHGLEVALRGLVTQPFKINGQPTGALIDLVKLKLRLGGSQWPFSDYGPPELLNNVKTWLESNNQKVSLEVPPLDARPYRLNENQVKAYAQALWWCDEQFKLIKQSLPGQTSPSLLYPHHFDLAFSWFPLEDARQLTVGFAAGDHTIVDPYIYLSVYPQPDGWLDHAIKEPAYWQTKDFIAAVLPYSSLATAAQPDQRLSSFIGPLISAYQKSLI